MTNINELIDRLRSAANGLGGMKTDAGDYGLLSKAADALEAASAPVAVVKPLEWGRSGAKTPFGNYIVTCEDHDSDTVWFVMFGGRVVSSLGAHSTEAESKAAAQSDYGRRILSAIALRSEAEIRADERAKIKRYIDGNNGELPF